MMVDVQGMYYELAQYFRRYCGELMESENIDLRKNFINKMDDITKKWEGIEIIDNLWFAICEKEKSEIARPNGTAIFFEVISNGTALRVCNSRHPTRGGTRVSKDDIEDALYYWPNQKAIEMLDKGSYIYPILNLCKDIADDIIQRQIA